MREIILTGYKAKINKRSLVTRNLSRISDKVQGKLGCAATNVSEARNLGRRGIVLCSVKTRVLISCMVTFYAACIHSATTNHNNVSQFEKKVVSCSSTEARS